SSDGRGLVIGPLRRRSRVGSVSFTPPVVPGSPCGGVSGSRAPPYSPRGAASRSRSPRVNASERRCSVSSASDAADASAAADAGTAGSSQPRTGSLAEPEPDSADEAEAAEGAVGNDVVPAPKPPSGPDAYASSRRLPERRPRPSG